MKRYLILLITVILSAVSCTTTRYISREPSLKAEWVGHSHADIVRNFGAPSRGVSDGAEGVILVYEDIYTTLETDQSGSTLTTTKKDHRNFKEFSLGPDDICYNVRTNEKMADGQVCQSSSWKNLIYMELESGQPQAPWFFDGAAG